MSEKEEVYSSVTESDGPAGPKKARLDDVVTVTSLPETKENKGTSPLKIYPKRSRTLSVKSLAILHETSKATTVVTTAVDTVNESRLLKQIPQEVNNDNLTVNLKTGNSKIKVAKGTTKRTAAAVVAEEEAKPNVASERPKSMGAKEKAEKAKSVSGKNTEKAKFVPGKNTEKAKAKAKEAANKRKQTKTVDKILESMGVNVRSASLCIKSAMSKGFIPLTGEAEDLEAVVYEGNYDGHTFKVLLKDVIYQPDYGGDYEDGSEAATATCTCCSDNGDDDCPCKAYLTRVCQNDAQLDSGKFHNHCGECAGFGKCIGDYREAHCKRCNKHWFQGLQGFPCANCERQQGRGFGGGIGGLVGGGLYNSDSEEEERGGTCVIA